MKYDPFFWAHHSTYNMVEPPTQSMIWKSAGLFGIAFWGAAVASRYLCVSESSYIPFWLPTGLYLAMLFANGTRMWPHIMVAAFIANAIFDLLHDTPVTAFLGFYSANTVQAFTGTLLLGRFVPTRQPLNSLREFMCLVFVGAGLAPIVGGVLGAGTLVGSGFSQSFFAAWSTWWANSVMANLLVVPFFLVWIDKPFNDNSFNSSLRIVEFCLLLVGMAALTWFLLVVGDGILSPNKSLLLVFPLWAAIRFGLRGVTIVNLSLAALMAFFTTSFLKGLTPQQVANGDYIVTLQATLSIAVLVSLLPAIVIQERDQNYAQLQGSQQRTELATETTGVGIWEWNLEDNTVLWDKKMFQIYGIDLTANRCVRYDTWSERVVPEQLPKQEEILRDTIQKRGQSFREFQIRRRNDGEIRTIQAIEVVRLDLVGNTKFVVGTNFDITQRKRDEMALRTSEERFRKLVEHANDVVSLYDLNGTILYESPGVEYIKGFNPAELIGTSAFRQIHPDDLEFAMDKLTKTMSEANAVTRMELRIIHRDGSSRWLDFVVTNLIKDPAIQAIVANYRDITERRTTDEELRASRQRLESLSRKLLSIQETERKHLARELHDELGQILTAIKFKIRQSQRIKAESIESNLDESVQMVDQAINQIRNLALQLRPAQLDQLGLAAALHWLMKQQAMMGGFEELLEVNIEDCQLSTELETVCFRITQEALTNVVRHANASMVHVKLSATNDRLFLSIQDNGIGFDVDENQCRGLDGGSFGLLSIRERASLVGGNVEIKSTIENGTTINAEFPLPSSPSLSTRMSVHFSPKVFG